MQRIFRLKKKYKFKILEDACHALGLFINTKNKIGSCKFSDICVFSFHPEKLFKITGRGGMITTNSKKCLRNMLV